jgi:hypothetical protein
MESRNLSAEIEILTAEIKKVEVKSDKDARQKSELFRKLADCYVSLFNITQDFLHLSLADTHYQSAIDTLACTALKPSIYLRLSLFAVRQDKDFYQSSDRSEPYINALRDSRKRLANKQGNIGQENPFNFQSYVDQPFAKYARKK